MNNRNMMVAVSVVFIVLFIIVPIPTFLLDVLLVTNITLSLLIFIKYNLFYRHTFNGGISHNVINYNSVSPVP